MMFTDTVMPPLTDGSITSGVMMTRVGDHPGVVRAGGVDPGDLAGEREVGEGVERQDGLLAHLDRADVGLGEGDVAW